MTEYCKNRGIYYNGFFQFLRPFNFLNKDLYIYIIEKTTKYCIKNMEEIMLYRFIF